jgi:protoporphyrinogen oxidase
MAKPKTYVIQGSGLPSIFSALFLIERGLGSQTLILESSDTPGGLLRSTIFDGVGKFDQGMHNLQETGNPEIDRLVFPVLPNDHWNILDGNNRDLAGTIRRGKIHSGSVYLDLREEKAAGSNLIDAFVGHVNAANLPLGFDDNPNLSAEEFLSARFGTLAASPYIRRLEGKFGLPADQLSMLACRLTPMDRFVAFDEIATGERYSETQWTRFLAWPDQRTLPAHFSSGRRSFYPRAGGMQTWLDAALAFLLDNGVEIRTRSRVVSCHVSGRSGSLLEISGPDSTESLECQLLIWTIGRSALIESLVNVPFMDRTPVHAVPDPPMRTWLVHMVIEGALPLLGDLHYVFDHSDGSLVHRLTNYAAFCTEMASPEYPKISIELLDPLNKLKDEKSAIDQALSSVEIPAGIDREMIMFSKGIDIGRGYPVPSKAFNNRAQVEGEYLESLGLDNVLVMGSKPELGVFFQGEVLQDAWERIAKWKN